VTPASHHSKSPRVTQAAKPLHLEVPGNRRFRGLSSTRPQGLNGAIESGPAPVPGPGARPFTTRVPPDTQGTRTTEASERYATEGVNGCAIAPPKASTVGVPPGAAQPGPHHTGPCSHTMHRSLSSQGPRPANGAIGPAMAGQWRHRPSYGRPMAPPPTRPCRAGAQPRRPAPTPAPAPAAPEPAPEPRPRRTTGPRRPRAPGRCTRARPAARPPPPSPPAPAAPPARRTRTPSPAARSLPARPAGTPR
jgi:hypothetical protein